MRSPFFLNQNWLQVANSSGEVIPPFSVVYNYSPAVANNNFGFYVDKPNAASTDFYLDYFVTGPYAIAAASGAEGIASSLSSIGFVRTNGSPTAGAVWGPKHDQFTLESNYYGFFMHSNSTTINGYTVALAKQVGFDEIIGKTDASCQNAASVTVSVYGAAAAGSETDTGANLTSCFNRGRYIYSGEWVRVTGLHGVSYVLPASGSQLLRGQTDAAIAKDASGTVSVYTDGGSDTGDNITATNLIASITASGKDVLVEWCNGTYFIVACECPI